MSELDPLGEVLGEVDLCELEELGGVQLEDPAWTVIVPPTTEA